MFKTALAGLLLVPVIVFIQSNQKAEALEITQPIEIKLAYSQPLAIATFDMPVEIANQIKDDDQEKPAEITYTIAEHDSLSKIAAKYDTTWKRIFDKNTSIEHPDVITPGLSIIIPGADETLAERPLPAAPEPAPEPAQTAQVKTAYARTTRTTSYSGTASSSGNLYVPGYCTWYVKNKRPDLPNNLGNADTWVSRAAAQGLPTGSTPRAGAVGQRGMHVVYVESINADGSVNISEMNHQGLYVITYRTLPANYFMYIY